MVIKVPRFTIGSYGLSLAYSRSKSSTNALLHGFSDADYERLRRYLKSDSCMHASFQSPLLVASQILGYYRENAERHRQMIDEHIYTTESSLGYAVPGSLMYDYGPQSTAKIDPERIVQKLQNSHNDYMRKLHLCQIELVALTHAANFGKDLGFFLQKVSEEMDAMQLSAQCKDADRAAANEAMLHDIDFQISLWSTLLSQKSALKERTHIHINLVSVPLLWSD